uniref:Methyltransferase type 11 domain-containing protein n=1 Tax=Euplotes harpa TaxID=151035 RepID=A0A7S3JFS8_9SPIT|mmetsp:Transcript_34487/g.39903  ORF Transcript_34487/g.39903 Transcript_34487/m.39903 type:complete len:141 (+) Transcript_34487:272-694(+)
MGYTNIVGLDASPEMLEEAKAKDAYVELVERFLCIPEGIPDSLKNRFEGVTAAGVLFLGYMGAEVFDEMLEMLKPGGYASFTSREDLHIKMGYHDKIEKLVEEGKWEHISTADFIKFQHAADELTRFHSMPAKHYVYKKL